MPGTNFVLLDSDALIGLANSADTNHQKSLLISNFLAQNNFGTIIPYPIVLEAATALSRNTKINRPDLANEILVNYIRTENWLNMDQNVESQVSQSFSKNTSRKNTPFDHYLLALARKNGIKYVFSFDSFYQKQGLSLAEDLLKS
ncbi:hypothetical protein A2721_01865 [Candidatus Gottesmanbacteria bacterium RIFCSPHIGHO2_01_FULL_47_48]|uniref:PIN domain-containing protein n=1 Tax=Candidatus Gottesmanbacteria bacterium RIFCSPHIGHO2_01_FULL_47_48 TaxID=1798381 RepID=A0A1F6A227_9BACT|nr:MAG: hypothetical protein A2721_01865 [Candidatus Gottesmanbacteria bacterium RIFCSPHIGHO2_01_FULL_47_48]